MTLLKMIDESLAGEVLNEIEIQVEREICTVGELITARVWAEVEKYNARADQFFRGLVQPSDAERTLNGFRMPTNRHIDPEKQAYVALDAFKKNAFFVLIDNRQVASLEEEVLVMADTRIAFLRLVPLVGG